MECELIEKLNSATNNEYNFSLKSACLEENADFCVFEIYYKDGVILSADKKTEIKSIMSSIIPQNFSIEVKFVKNYLSEERAVEEFGIFMKTNFPSFAYELKSVRFDDGKFCFRIVIDELVFAHAQNKNLCKVANEFFKNKFEGYEFLFEIEEGKVFKEESGLRETFKEEEVDMYALRKIEVEGKEVYIGEEITESASYIKDKDVISKENVIFCGTIKHIKANTYKPKKKPKEEKEETEENKVSENEDTKTDTPKTEDEKQKTPYEKKYYKWTLSDFTGEIPCQYFATKATQAKMDVLEENKPVIIKGNLEFNKFSEELNLVVKDISFCTLPEKFEEFIAYHEEKPFYEWVEPEKMVTYKQDDLLSFMQEEQVAPFLQNKTFVCYDLETTGFHYEAGDRIIEVGAVKIENGKITEKFVSLVNPGRSIPASASAVNHIYDEDVKDALKPEQVLQDFYKFTRGAILVGQNIINFDNVFLRGQGKVCRYNFNNDSVDVLELARKYVFGVKNYKLGTIAEKLGVKLENAHRAFNDTLATAEVFIKLAANIEVE